MILKMLVFADAGNAFCLLLMMTAALSTTAAAADDDGTTSTPTTWTQVYQGCFTDKSSKRLMTRLASADDNNMTTTYCAELAAAKGYTIFATQRSNKCFGSNNLAKAKRLGRSKACNKACAGDKNQTCGGHMANSLYSIHDAPDAPDIPETPWGDIQFLGLSPSQSLNMSPLATAQCLDTTGNVDACRWSTNQMFAVCLQTDRNIVLYKYPNGVALGQKIAYWSTKTSTAGGGPYKLCMQGDGNLVGYKAGVPFWASGSRGGANRLYIQTDGNLVIYSAANQAVWSSNTVLPSSCPPVAGYTASAPGDDFSGDFIKKVDAGNLASIAAACRADCACTSFNSGGYILRATTTNRIDSAFCFYKRNFDRCPSVTGYTAYPNQGHGGDDLSRFSADSPLCIAAKGAAACNNECYCSSFNSDGWLKRKFQMDARSYPGMCSYVKDKQPVSGHRSEMRTEYEIWDVAKLFGQSKPVTTPFCENGV